MRFRGDEAHLYLQFNDELIITSTARSAATWSVERALGWLASLVAAPAAGGRKRPSSPTAGTLPMRGSLAVRSPIGATTSWPPRGSVARISDPFARPAALARGLTALRQQLPPLLDRLAAALDQSAELAEQHAMRLSTRRDAPGEALEYERAKRARDAAEAARTQAQLVRQRMSTKRQPP